MSDDTSLTPAQQRVIERLYEGKYAAAIADELDVTRQAVHKHVKALKRKGFIRENPGETAFYRRTLGPGTSIKIYGLTPEGLEALRQAQEPTSTERLTSASAGSAEPVNRPPVENAPERQPRVEVHNFEVKIPVVELGLDWLPNAAQMQNWTRKWDPNFHGVYLEVTTENILLRAGAEAPNRAMAEGLCLRKLMRVMELLERHYGCKLGRPEFRCVYEPGKTKVGVVDHPLGDGQGYQEGELATIDDTPEEGTIHPTDDPNDADRIVEMARNSEATRELLEGLVDQQTRFYASLSRLLRPDEPGEDDPDDTGMEIA